MGLYKPQSQFISPNNETINAQVENNFISKVSGDLCSAYIWRIKNQKELLSGSDIGLNTLNKLTNPLYNDDELVLNMPANWFLQADRQKFLNVPLAWNVTMLGKEKNITASEIVTREYETEDETVSKQIEELKQKNTDILNSNSQINIKATEQTTDLQIQILKIQADPNLSQEEKKKKIDELEEQIEIIESGAEAQIKENQKKIEENNKKIEELKENIMVTKTYTEAVVTITNPNFTTGEAVYLDFNSEIDKNFYYIRMINTNQAKIYDTREKAIGLDATSPDYKAEDFGSVNLTGKHLYSWARSDDIRFRAIKVGSLTLTGSKIDRFIHVFTPIYEQENEIPINRFQASLYDENKVLIDQSEVVYSSNIQYTFSGLMTGDIIEPEGTPTARTYYVRFEAYNDVEYHYDTGLVAFSVEYKTAQLDTILDVINDCQTASITIDWRYLVSIPGFVECFEFRDNFMWDGNTGLYLCPKETLTYKYPEIKSGGTFNEKDKTVTLDRGSLPVFVWQPTSTDFKGIIYKNYQVNKDDNDKETGKYTSVFYDGEKIGLEVNGVRVATQWFDIEQDATKGEPYVYLIGVWKHEVSIHKFLVEKLPEKPKINSFNVVLITRDSAQLIVDADSDKGIRDYTWYVDGNEVGKTTLPNYNVKNLKNNTEYTAQVKVTANDGEFTMSDVETFKTLYGIPVITSISPNTVSPERAVLTVNVDSELQIIQYRMTYGNDNIGWKTITIPTPTFYLENLVEGETYTAKVVVTDESLQNSDMFEYTFSGSADLLSVDNVTLEGVSKTSVIVNVEYTTTVGLKSIVYNIDEDTVDVKLQNPYTLSGLSSNTVHRLVVMITDNNNNIAMSSAIKFKTLANPPVIEKVEVTEIGNSYATINVIATAEAGIARYELYLVSAETD